MKPCASHPQKKNNLQAASKQPFLWSASSSCTSEPGPWACDYQKLGQSLTRLDCSLHTPATEAKNWENSRGIPRQIRLISSFDSSSGDMASVFPPYLTTGLRWEGTQTIKLVLLADLTLLFLQQSTFNVRGLLSVLRMCI